VTWLPFTRFAYNNSIHALIGMTLFYAEQMVQFSILEAVCNILADEFMAHIPNAKAQAEQMVELHTFTKKC
jgi:hypothetical protein